MPDESLHIRNAGLVLLAPFYPRYFEINGLLLDGKFKDTGAAALGVRLLQILVSTAPQFSENDLTLNKLLCGVAPFIPLGGDFVPSESEVATAESLLRSAMASLSKLANTSLDGFRESFLARPGTLIHIGSEWRLRVEKRSWDVVLTTVPWTFGLIAHPWMSEPIHVEWP